MRQDIHTTDADYKTSLFARSLLCLIFGWGAGFVITLAILTVLADQPWKRWGHKPESHMTYPDAPRGWVAMIDEHGNTNYIPCFLSGELTISGQVSNAEVKP